ncbi:MAG: DUF1624 domain-containing protein [Candidatus Diapherotrites archaeon]|nr:DUF1624 domain-containing protein [Candidatus Diapherotrites archaeon]
MKSLSKGKIRGAEGEHGTKSRFFEIDLLRGIAVLMMVLFHFLWDLNYFEFISVSLYEGFFGLFQKATAGTFLFLVGVVLSISFGKSGENFQKKVFVRSAKIFSYAMLVTIFSLLFFPQEPIFFGILHLIAVSILLSTFFVRLGFLNLILSAFFVFSPLFFDYSSQNLKLFFWIGLAKSPPALDFFPLIPWFGAVLAGIFAGNYFYKNGTGKFEIKNPGTALTDFVAFLGRHSLFIYFAHQPVLFSLVGISKVILFKTG